MTELLLLVFVLTVLSSAFLAFLASDAKLTEPVRENTFNALNAPAEEQHKQDIATYEQELEAHKKKMDSYKRRVENAMLRNEAIPSDAPKPPVAPDEPDEPFLVALLKCRWCTGLWTSFVVTIVTRLCLTVDLPPVWQAIPLHPLDWLIVPAWALAVAYAVGFLASREGD